MKKRFNESRFENGVEPNGSEMPKWYKREQIEDADRKVDMTIFFSKLTLRERDDFTALLTQQSGRDYGETAGIGYSTAWRRLKSIKAKWDKHLAS